MKKLKGEPVVGGRESAFRTGSVLFRPMWRSVLVVGAVGLTAAGVKIGIQCRPYLPPGPGRIAWLKAHTPPGMIFVPGGSFEMGKDGETGNSLPRHRAWTPSFYIDRYPVTRRQYAAFDHTYGYPPGQGDYPITNLTRDQAQAYLKSVGKVLPTEAEWEKAARGTDGRTYPWGDHPSHWLDRSIKRRSFCPVTRYAQPPSPYGARDMSGTVWQWVRDNEEGTSQQIIRGGATGYGLTSDATYSRGIEGAGTS